MNKIIRLVIFALLLAGIAWVVANRQLFDTAKLELFINNAGVIAPIIFMLIYAIGTVLFFPGSVLTLLGGAVFGPVWGTLYNLTGAVKAGCRS